MIIKQIRIQKSNILLKKHEHNYFMAKFFTNIMLNLIDISWNQKNGNNKGDFLKGKDKFQKDKNYVGPTKEERELEKQKKLEKRKKNFRNMNKKTQFGQPIMKFRIENLLHKIKSKIKKGDY